MNDNDNNEVMDREECFQQIVGLFPGGVGKRGEFESKTRAKFDALLDKGADPEAVLSRAREHYGKFDFPIQLLERQDLFSGLFRADPAEVINWCASYGCTTASAAAREIYEIAEADPDPVPSEETKRRAWEIYRANERELQEVYARTDR